MCQAKFLESKTTVQDLLNWSGVDSVILMNTLGNFLDEIFDAWSDIFLNLWTRFKDWLTQRFYGSQVALNTFEYFPYPYMREENSRDSIKKIDFKM